VIAPASTTGPFQKRRTSSTKAKALYARVVALCARADTERPELRHAKDVLAK